jgi:hypothetical protein
VQRVTFDLNNGVKTMFAFLLEMLGFPRDGWNAE